MGSKLWNAMAAWVWVRRTCRPLLFSVAESPSMGRTNQNPSSLESDCSYSGLALTASL